LRLVLLVRGGSADGSSCLRSHAAVSLAGESISLGAVELRLHSAGGRADLSEGVHLESLRALHASGGRNYTEASATDQLVALGAEGKHGSNLLPEASVPVSLVVGGAGEDGVFSEDLTAALAEGLVAGGAHGAGGGGAVGKALTLLSLSVPLGANAVGGGGHLADAAALLIGALKSIRADKDGLLKSGGQALVTRLGGAGGAGSLIEDGDSLRADFLHSDHINSTEALALRGVEGETRGAPGGNSAHADALSTVEDVSLGAPGLLLLHALDLSVQLTTGEPGGAHKLAGEDTGGPASVGFCIVVIPGGAVRVDGLCGGDRALAVGRSLGAIGAEGLGGGLLRLHALLSRHLIVLGANHGGCHSLLLDALVTLKLTESNRAMEGGGDEVCPLTRVGSLVEFVPGGANKAAGGLDLLLAGVANRGETGGAGSVGVDCFLSRADVVLVSVALWAQKSGGLSHVVNTLGVSSLLA